MRAVVQRVLFARVRIGGRVAGEIGRGLLVFAGVETGDGPDDVEYVASKVNGLRVFDDSAGRMNMSMGEAGGSALVVSQFTLCGDCRRGRRPSFDAAESPAAARGLYDQLVRALRDLNVTVATGEFQAHMDVELSNDGPVTLLLDSRRRW
jgi:D-tyrosyl-tRNA(Tyr) deacylase